jgi:dTDP-4-dehydrorhamnose reductase
MKINNILILGSSGMLGYAAEKYFRSIGKNVEPLSRKKFDISKDPIEKLTRRLKKNDVVINCAGVIKPRINDFSTEEVLTINGTFPWNLARMCNNFNIPCFHITTDCVYSGNRGSYDERDFVDAHDLYGLSKAAGDTNLCMTLRTSIIGEEKTNNRSLLEWAKNQKGKTVNGFTNHKWNGVTTLTLCMVISKILAKNIYQMGIFHIYSPEIITKFELLKIINEVYGLNLKIKKVRAPEKIDRSLSSVHSLSTSLIKDDLNEQIKKMKNFFSS